MPMTFLRKIRQRGAFTLTELSFVVFIIIVFLLILTPFINNIRSKAQIVGCRENIEKLSMGLRLYASEHNGKFPSSLIELVEDGYIDDERVFNCPGTGYQGDALEPEYHYTTGCTILSPSDQAMLFDKTGNHKDGKHILYVSGEIKWEYGAMAE